MTELGHTPAAEAMALAAPMFQKGVQMDAVGADDDVVIMQANRSSARMKAVMEAEKKMAAEDKRDQQQQRQRPPLFVRSSSPTVSSARRANGQGQSTSTTINAGQQRELQFFDPVARRAPGAGRMAARMFRRLGAYTSLKDQDGWKLTHAGRQERLRQLTRTQEARNYADQTALQPIQRRSTRPGAALNDMAHNLAHKGMDFAANNLVHDPVLKTGLKVAASLMKPSHMKPSQMSPEIAGMAQSVGQFNTFKQIMTGKKPVASNDHPDLLVKRPDDELRPSYGRLKTLEAA